MCLVPHLLVEGVYDAPRRCHYLDRTWAVAMTAKRDLVVRIHWKFNIFPCHGSDARVPDLAGDVVLSLLLRPCFLLTINNQSTVFAVLDVAIPTQYQESTRVGSHILHDLQLCGERETQFFGDFLVEGPDRYLSA